MENEKVILKVSEVNDEELHIKIEGTNRDLSLALFSIMQTVAKNWHDEGTNEKNVRAFFTEGTQKALDKAFGGSKE